MRVLDLFCGAGGASAGYALAGLEVVGVDIADQPRYPFEFHRADALAYAAEHGGEYDLIHASPPCQQYSSVTQPARSRGKTYPDLVAPTRERLRASGVPYVIENVPNAPLIDPVMLCGTMFGLQVYRHRKFEASFPITPPPHPGHTERCAEMGRDPKPGEWMTVVGLRAGLLDASIGAMGTWWMTGHELSESIPPAYSLFIGRAFLAWSRVRNCAGDPDAGADAAASGTTAEILTRLPDTDDGRRARERKLAAECSQRYRDRKRGKSVPRLRPGPKPGRESITRARRRYEAAELARLRTVLAALGMTDERDGDDEDDEAPPPRLSKE